jgi:hypothetical protein
MARFPAAKYIYEAGQVICWWPSCLLPAFGQVTLRQPSYLLLASKPTQRESLPLLVKAA